MLAFAELCFGMGHLFWPPMVALDAPVLLETVVKIAPLIKEWVLCNYNSRCCHNVCSDANHNLGFLIGFVSALTGPLYAVKWNQMKPNSFSKLRQLEVAGGGFVVRGSETSGLSHPLTCLGEHLPLLVLQPRALLSAAGQGSCHLPGWEGRSLWVGFDKMYGPTCFSSQNFGSNRTQNY